MPRAKVTISQGQLIVDEYGNSVEFTGKLETLAEFDVENLVLKALRDDAALVLDTEVANVFKGCKVKATPNTSGTIFSETGAPGGTANKHVDLSFVRDVVDEMKARYWVPLYDGENYLCVCSVKFGRRIREDPDWEDAAKYGDPERLFSGETGRIAGVRFVEETNALSNTLGTTTFQGEAVFFGADAVVEGVAVPLEIRAKIATDYGRDKGLAWYFLGGWARTFDSATPGEVRIVHVTSN